METKPPMSSSSDDTNPDRWRGYDDELILPDGTNFHPVRHAVSYEVITRLSEARLPLINGRPGAQEERLARMAPEKFRLLPPDL